MKSRSTAIFLILGLILKAVSSSCFAEVVTDGSVGPSGSLGGPDFAVTADWGKQVGGNLFHSFQSFNLHTGESATFSGPDSVQYVISRVTGGTGSWIDGALNCTIAGADFYFLNPVGVMFGANASLNLKGSFYASTADYLRLGEDGRVDAVQPQNSVFVASPPTAFGFLGPGSGISVSNAHLEVPEGKTLSLVSGDITLTGANITAPGGRITLAAKMDAGEVSPDIPADNASATGNIAITDKSKLVTSGNRGGDFYIRSGRFEVADSEIRAQTTGDQDGGGVDIRADVISFSDASLLKTTTKGSGNGGSIQIDARELTLSGGAQISSNALEESSGDAGSIRISATESIAISGQDEDGYHSGIFSDTFSTGSGGFIAIKAPSIQLDNGTINAAVYPGAEGNGGAIQIEAGRLAIAGGGGIYVGTEGSGNVGSITIAATESINVSGHNEAGDNSSIAANTWAAGTGGRINISAPVIELDNEGSIQASVGQGAAGNGGSIQIDVGKLTMAGGAGISSNTKGNGAAGSIAINAVESISISGKDEEGNYSRIKANTYSTGTGGRIDIKAPAIYLDDVGYIQSAVGEGADGNAGSIQIDAGRLAITGGGFIDSSTFGCGHAGSIIIAATESISVSGQNEAGYRSAIAADSWSSGTGGRINISAPVIELDNKGSIQALVGQGATGNGGDIQIDAGKLDMASGADIKCTTMGNGAAGSISINATESISIAGKDQEGVYSKIISDTYSTGAGGQIDIKAPAIYLLDGKSFITASVGVGASGNGGSIQIDTGELALLGNAYINASTMGSGAGGTIKISAAESISIFQNEAGKYGQIAANAYSTGKGGSIEINTPLIEMDKGVISTGVATNAGGNGGSIQINSEDLILSLSNGAQIFSKTYGGGDAGNIQIKAQDLTLSLPDSTYIASSTSGTGDAGNIEISATESITISGQNDGGAISAHTSAAGNGGNIELSAPVINLDNINIIAPVSVNATGNGGNISIDAGKLAVTGGAFISSSTLGSGNAGNIEINATESVSISGKNEAEKNSYIAVSTDATGNGGAINITSPSIKLDGAFIDASTTKTATGNGGAIQIDTGNLVLFGGAMIGSFTRGNGDAGPIKINATESISISGRGEATFSGAILASTSATGAGGPIEINAPSIRLDEGNISAGAFSNATGNSGDIYIDTEHLNLSGNSVITAQTDGGGTAGDIFITAEGSISLSGASTITDASAGTGNAGNISITSGNTIDLGEDSSITTEATSADGGNISLQAGYMLHLDESRVTTTVNGGAGNGGNIAIDPRYVILNHGSIIANAYEGAGGNIDIQAGTFLSCPESVVSASSQLGIDGTVDIKAPVVNISGFLSPMPKTFLSERDLTANPCADRMKQGKPSSFVVRGRDGLPLAPGTLLGSGPYEHNAQ